VTTTDSISTGTSISVETTVGENLLGEDVEMSITVSVSFNYTHTTSTSNSTTVTQGLSISQNFTAPPNTSTTGTLIAKMGTLPPTTYTTTAQRWYTQQLTGTTLDPSNGWYVRTETVTGTVAGKLCGSSTVNVSSTALVPAMAN
jgi:hypothetical protein